MWNVKRQESNSARWWLVVVLQVAAFFSGGAQRAGLSERESASIDSLMTVYMSGNRVPGASVAVVKEGRLVWERGYGFANLELFVPATPSTIYRLASVSKPVTSIAVMQLVERGKIALDSPVQHYLPAFPKKKFPITTRQLLSHLSGIRHYSANEFRSNVAYPSLREALRIFENDSLLHQPGEEQTYSTYGYTLLGAIVEAVTGKTFMAYLEESVFRPAGMTHTYADDPLAIIPYRSAFYDTLRRGTVGHSIAVNTSYKIPGGGLLSGVKDMARFLMAIQEGRLVKPATWKLMTTEVKTTKGMPTHYGLGWILGIPPIEGVPRIPSAVWHGGVQQGSTTAVLMMPEKRIAVVVLSNLGELGNEITATVARIAEVVRREGR